MLRYYSFIKRAVFFLLFIILIVYCLSVARSLLYPLGLGILFAYLLYPLGRFLEKYGVPRIFSNFICLIVAAVIFFGIIVLMSSQLAVFVKDFPQLKNKTIANMDQLVWSLEEYTGISADVQKEWIKSRINDFFESGSQLIGTALNATAGTLVALGILPVYVFFILYYRNKFIEFILLIVPDRIHDKTHKILDEVTHVIKRYMTGITMVVLILCVINSLGLMIVGVDYPILLGIISAFFNFIPYFGTLIGGCVPLIIAMITMESPRYILGIIILFLVVQFVENNILTPNITGGNVRLNPLVTILSILVGGMLWGVPGMFLSVPFLAMFKIVCDHVDALKPVSFLLGTDGTEEHALTLAKLKRFFRGKK